MLPLLPVAVNLAHGLPFWIGPRGIIESFVRTYLWELTPFPVADQVRGPVTSRGDCEPPERGRGADGELRTPPPTGERAFVCTVRTSEALPSARSIPDQALVAYGHRLCGVYTRNDPGELARVRETGGPDVRTLPALLVDICPRAAEVVRAQSVAEEREMLEWEAKGLPAG
ncbi:hypothetical protein [Streptosporangium sp. NPDC002544]|uniref:hypothetical protein n=1 Tax=unclassified Streptosporangium TaxID=2632669 RepID=UPI0033269391